MRYLAAAAVSVALIAALFVFSWVMDAEMLKAAELGRDLSRTEMVLANLARFWGHFWRPLSLMIIGGVFIIASALPKRKRAAPPGSGPIG